MEASAGVEREHDEKRSRLPWLGGFLGIVIGLVVLVVSWPAAEHRSGGDTVFLGGTAGATDDASVITAVDAIQNLAGAYLDDGDAKLAADAIGILTSSRDRREVFFRLFERYHKRLNVEVDRASAALAGTSERRSPITDPDANVVPIEAEGTAARAHLSEAEMLQQLSLLHEFVLMCDDTRLKTRCLAKLAETRLDIADAENPPRRRDLVESAKSLAQTMSQGTNDEPPPPKQTAWQWLVVVALPLLTGLAGTAAVKLTEAFASELGKTFSKVVAPAKEEVKGKS